MEELNKKIIALYQEMGSGQGINDPLLMEIFARIYIEPDPIAMDDLAKETGYSLASISNKVNLIGPLLQIKKIRKPGSKKLFLCIEKDMLKIWKEVLLNKEEHVINNAKEKLPEIIKEYKSKAKTTNEKRKLKVLEDYYAQILKFEVILSKTIKEFEKVG